MKVNWDKIFKEASIKRINDEQFKRTGKIFPSSAGTNCEQQLRYDFIGQDQKKDYVHHGKENKIGNAIHDELQKDFKHKFKDKVEIEKRVTYVVKDLQINGKVDIILDKTLVIEIKTVKDEEGNEPDLKHVKQIQWYLGVLGLKNAVLSYFNRSKGTHINSFDIQFDKNMFDLIVKKFERVIEGTELNTDTRECSFCPYSYICPSYKRPVWVKKQK